MSQTIECPREGQLTDEQKKFIKNKMNEFKSEVHEEDEAFMYRIGMENAFKEANQKTEAQYEHICKGCYGVGEVGIPMRDGSYENRTCDCVNSIKELVWKEATDFVFQYEELSGSPPNHKKMKAEGKKRGYE